MLNPDQRTKVLALFKRFADFGPLNNREKLRSLGGQGGRGGKDLFEFKSFQVRLIGDFRKGRRFLVAHGLIKKQGRLRPQVVARAVRILEQNDNFETEREQRR